MIQKVSAGNSYIRTAKTGNSKADSPLKKGMDTVKTYTDSFVKHTKKSAPIIFGLTTIWAIADRSEQLPFKKAFTNNLKNFFVPVLVMSSALLTIIENKKSKKDSTKQ